jgi:hypothetical protein
VSSQAVLSIGSVAVRARVGADPEGSAASHASARWVIAVQWSAAESAPDGHWRVRAFVEALDTGPDMQIGPTRIVPVDAAPGGRPRRYATAIPIPEGCVPPGRYRLTVGLDLEDGTDRRAASAFRDAGVVQLGAPARTPGAARP